MSYTTPLAEGLRKAYERCIAHPEEVNKKPLMAFIDEHLIKGVPRSMICKATINDAPIVAQLAAKLWPHHTVDEMLADFEETIQNETSTVFLCYDSDAPVGFAQCGLRHDYVEGTSSSPVGYLEGIYVDPPYRNRGYAKQLLAACETWAKEQGCAEFASDCELHNTDSMQFHLNVGFEEANRIICFRKTL